MEFFKSNTRIPFMRQQKVAAVFSIIIFIASIIALAVNGLNLGLDFTGGNQLVAKFPKPVAVNVVRQKLEAGGFREAEVQAYNAHELAIKIGPHDDLVKQNQLKAKVQSLLPDNGRVLQSEYLGSSVGKQLWSNGLLAMLVAIIGTMIYIALRFEYRFAISAAIALIHDPMLIFGIFAAFHLEFNMIVLTAVLTVIGYSLNDTIVVYDRVRENFRKVRKGTPKEVMDLSINQTLSRTIMTSGLTLLVVIALFFWGGPVVHWFSLALIIGIVIGTYSSIYVAGSMAIALGLTRHNLLPPKKTEIDDLP